MAKKIECDWDKKKKLDPKDFIISKLEGTSITKTEGSIDGQQFIVEDCKNCDIFLCDFMATVSFDYCENCRIFCGPVESSVFVRNCKNCEFVMACQQFRSRDCENCRFALFSMTEPVVETSRGMHFACFDFVYFSLKEQFNRAGLKIWNNKWWQIHDFNKNLQDPNWHIFPQEDVRSMLRISECSIVTEDEQALDKVVPVTLGPRKRPFPEACFVIFLPKSDNVIEGFLSKVQASPEWVLCRTRSIIVDEGRAKALFGWSKDSSAKQSRDQEVVGIELCGSNITSAVQAFMLQEKHISQSARIPPAASTASLAQMFFETWKDEI